MSTVKFDTWQNTDGTENYKCRAWVNFNGSGTVAIRAGGNVSSITDNGVGDYTANFTTAMSDANYTFVAQSGDFGSAGGTSVAGARPYNYTTTSIRIRANYAASNMNDWTAVNIAIFR